jgi:dodecin
LDTFFCKNPNDFEGHFFKTWLFQHPANRPSPVPKEQNMKDPVYKLIELTGTSTTSIEDAVDKAIKRAHKTIKNLCWFQVVETRGDINKGKVDHWQVTIKVGFTVEG